MNKDHEARRKALETILRKAQPLILEGYSACPGSDLDRQKLLGIQKKSSFADLVTVFDKRVEEFLIEELQKVFPGENIIGEESAPNRNDLRKHAEPLDSFWLIDPIDGTTNYTRAYPFFSSTMAWVENKNSHFQTVAGATFDPIKNEMFSAHLKGGTTLNGQTLKVSSVIHNENALFATGFAVLRYDNVAEPFEIFSRLTKKSLGVRRDGSAALDLAYVATGRIDGYWEFGLSPWDMATGSLLIEEAGGKITSPHHNDAWDLFEGSILSSNGQLHEWLRDALRKSEA